MMMMLLTICFFADYTLDVQSVTYFNGGFEISREVDGVPVTMTATNHQWAMQFLQDWLQGGCNREPDLYRDGRIDLNDFNEFARNYR